jgi:hypothetical protein
LGWSTERLKACGRIPKTKPANVTLTAEERVMVIRGLIERGYPGGAYALTAAGRAAFLALLERAGVKPT